MGTEEFWIPAVMAAVGSAGSAVNQSQANKREQQGEVQSIQDQQAIQEKATQAASQLTKQIATNTPQQIASQATGSYVNQLRRNAAGSATSGANSGGTQTGGASTSSLAPAVGASARYNSDKAASQGQVEQYGDTYADEMGQIDAAVRQRQNEGLAMNTLGTNLNLLSGQSYATNFVDQLRAQAAGTANPWVSLLSGLLGNGAKAAAMNWGSSATPAAARIGANGYTAAGTPVNAGNGLTLGPGLA
jgi:hypothetical protein